MFHLVVCVVCGGGVRTGGEVHCSASFSILYITFSDQILLRPNILLRVSVSYTVIIILDNNHNNNNNNWLKDLALPVKNVRIFFYILNKNWIFLSCKCNPPPFTHKYLQKISAQVVQPFRRLYATYIYECLVLLYRW